MLKNAWLACKVKKESVNDVRKILLVKFLVLGVRHNSFFIYLSFKIFK